MLIGLNGFTTAQCDLATDINLSQDIGFDCLEIRVEKLREYLKENNILKLKEVFQSSGVKPLSINAMERVTFRDKQGFSMLEQECHELCRVCTELRCPYIIVVPGPRTGNLTRDEIRKESISVLRKLGEIARGYGVSLSYEFMGFDWCVVNNLKECAKIVQMVKMENVGLVLDAFHFFVGGSSIADIERLDVNKLHIVHINDAANLARERLGDRDRLLPGEGIIPLRDIITVVKGIGYTGAVSIEVLQEKYWKREPYELCREAKARSLALLDEVHSGLTYGQRRYYE
jgi:2-keto-myo-inositol isomerase